MRHVHSYRKIQPEKGLNTEKTIKEQDKLWDDEVTFSVGVDSIKTLTDRLFPGQRGNLSQSHIFCSLHVSTRKKNQGPSPNKARFLYTCFILCAILLKIVTYNKSTLTQRHKGDFLFSTEITQIISNRNKKIS